MLKLRDYYSPIRINTLDTQFFFNGFTIIRRGKKGDWRVYKRHHSSNRKSFIDVMYKKYGHITTNLCMTFEAPLRARGVC